MSQNNANVPRLYNEYIVYDTVQSNSLVAISNTGSYNSIIFEKGILVNTADNSIPSFQSYNGILYYSNDGDLLSTELIANSMLYVNEQSKIEQIPTVVNNGINGINGGVLTTYSFDDKSLTINTNPKFSSQFILNNAEVVDNNNQRIDQPYLIYGKGYKTNDTGGISCATTISTEQNTTYNLLSVNNSNNTIELSNIHNVVQQLQSISKDNQSFQLVGFDNTTNNVSLLNSTSVNVGNNGNYVLNITGNGISLNTLDTAFGKVTPDKLSTDTTNNFDYTKHKLLSVNDNKFIEIPSYTNTNTLKYPYFTGILNVDGNYWQDLSIQPFLTVNNTTSINNINSFKPVVVNTTNSNICTLNNIGTGNYIISSVKGVCQYKQIDDITDVYVSGQNLNVTKINNRDNLGTNTLLNLSTILCMSNTNSTLFQNIGNVNTFGVLQIDTSGNIKVNNYIIQNINNLNTASNDFDTYITALNTASNRFNTQINNLSEASNTFAGQITNLSNAKCVISNTTTAININTILTNSNINSTPSNIKTHSYKYRNGVMYLDNNSNIQIIPPNTNDTVLIYNNGYNWNQIDSNQIANNAITNDKIANNAVMNNNIADGAVRGAKIADGAVTSNNIAVNAVTSNNIAVNAVTSNKIAANTVTSDKIAANAVTTTKIADGAVTSDKIANGAVTGSKLNFNDSQPSGSWKNVLMNNNDNNLVTTNANVTNYGVFTNTGSVTNLDASVLNSVGLKFFTPTTDEGKIDESSYLATRFIVYTSNSGNITFKPNFVSFLNYNKINNFDRSIICDYISNVNNDVLDKNLNGESSNTVSILYKNILNQQKDNIYVYDGKYLNFKTLLHIDSIQFANENINTYSYDTGGNSYQYSIENLKSDNLTLVIGVYTNLYPNLFDNTNVKYNDIIFLYKNIVMYHNNVINIRETLLGYILVNLTDIDNNGSIILNKDYEFNSSILIKDSNIIYYANVNSTDLLNKLYNNIISFRPLFYLKNNNITDIRSLYYNLPQEKYPTYDFLNKLSYSNINGDISYSFDNIPLTNVFYNYEVNTNIKYAKGVLCFPNTMYKLTNRTLMTLNDVTIYTFTSLSLVDTYYVFSDEKYIYVGGLSSQPIESEMKINVSPVTTYSNIQFNVKNLTEFTLTPSNYKFSIFDINLSITDYVGEYPSIIQ